jgi:hypothetical protein
VDDALIEWRGLRLLTDPTFDDAGSVFEHGPVVLRKTVRPAADVRTVESTCASGCSVMSTRTVSPP